MPARKKSFLDKDFLPLYLAIVTGVFSIGNMVLERVLPESTPQPTPIVQMQERVSQTKGGEEVLGVYPTNITETDPILRVAAPLVENWYDGIVNYIVTKPVAFGLWVILGISVFFIGFNFFKKKTLKKEE